MIKRFVAVLMLLGLSGSAWADEPPGRIAVLVPVSGPYAAYGELQMQGYELARVAMARQSLAAEIRYFDVGSPPGSIELFLHDEVLSWQPDIIVGPYSSERSAEVAAALGGVGIPLLLPSATQDSLTEHASDDVFRIAVPAAELAATLSDFILHGLPSHVEIAPIMVIAEKTPFAVSARTALAEAFRKDGIEAFTMIDYDSRELDGILNQVDAEHYPTVVVISRNSKDCRKITQTLQNKARVIGFSTGFLTPEFREHALRNSLEYYVLNPWKDDAPAVHAQAFIQAFANKYKGASFAKQRPQYHNAQAYSALMIAGQALKLSAEGQRSLSSVLGEHVFQTPLGKMSFVNYGAYYRQSTLSAVVQHVKEGKAETVFPPNRVVAGRQAAQTAVLAAPFWRSLLDNQFIALFAILALGLLLGNINVGGVSLGSSGVLFTALIFGHYHFTIPSGVGTLGLILFIYCVGISAGPSFFAAFKKQGATLAKLSIVVVVSAAALTVLMAKVFAIPVDLAVGILAGALTSTPALAAAMDTLRGLGGNVSVGYGIAYPFGVIGVVLFVQLLPRLLRKDLNQLGEFYESQLNRQGKIVVTHARVENKALFGKPIEANDFIWQSRCRISRVQKGDKLVPVQFGDTFAEGLILRVVGQEEVISSIVDYIGSKVETELRAQQPDLDLMEMVVTSREVVGKSLGELGLLRRFGVTVTRILRNEVAFVPNRDNKIDLHDQLRVVGDPDGLQKFSQECGHKAKALQETDVLSLSVGLMAGVMLGLLPISIGGMPAFTLGLSGGVLMVSLLLGHYGRIGIIVGRMPVAARIILMEIGLVFFLANAGVKAGGAFLEVLRLYGLKLFLVGAVLTLIPMLLGFTVGVRVFKLNLLQALGGICGGMTSTPALGAIKSKTDSSIPVVSYAAAYPVALIFMLIAAPLVVALIRLIP